MKEPLHADKITGAAQKVGDKTLPVSQRLAALNQLEILQDKYAALNGGASRGMSGGQITDAPKATMRFNPATGKVEPM